MGEDMTFPVLWDLGQSVGFLAAICAVALAFPCATASALCLPVPIPLWGVIPHVQRLVWLPTAKLWLSRREESSRWNQRLPVTQLWLFQVYQFLWQQKSTLRAELQLDGFPSRLHLQSFSLGSQSTNGTFSHFYHLDVWCSPPHSENVNVITCGGWGVGFCELFHWWWDMHSNFSSY